MPWQYIGDGGIGNIKYILRGMSAYIKITWHLLEIHLSAKAC